MKRLLILPLLAAAALSAAPPAAAQEQPPAPGPLRPFTVPRVEELRLPNGVRVVVVPQRSLPIVSGRIMVSTGANWEPAEKNGLASLTASLIDEGVQGMTGSQIAERMERLGAQFSTSGGYATSTASVSAVKSAFPEALELAARTVMQPTFPETEFNRVRAQTVAGYRQSLASVEGLASQASSRAIFEPTAPYSRPVSGTEATLAAITLQDVVDWHRRTYSPANTTLLLVGDVTVEEARGIAQRALGAWSAPAAQMGRVANPVRAAQGTRVILVDRPGSVQSALWIGQPSIGQSDPNFLRMEALSQVLGGGFKARANMNLRERHGWTYGAFTSFRPLDGVGTFSITASVRTNATDSAVAETVGEFRRIASEPVPAAELAGALNNVVGSFPSSVQTVQSLAGRMETLLVYGLPLDYWSTYRERLAAVTPADLSALGRGHLRPSGLTVVVAGDLSKIEQPIRALNLGTVEVWDASGNKVR